MTRRFKPPVFATTKQGTTEWTINLGDDERAIIVRLLGELRALLTSDDQSSPLLQRLFPPAFLDDPDKEAEYQRLMREELVASRVAQIDTVTDYLRPGHAATLDESGINAFLQSINAVRVVLGTLLDVGEDDDPSDDEMTPEHQLYAFLSWLLDWTVRSLST
ncbi:MAG: DUF2017 family protein [Ilumatobacter sp.]|uniref:DUF2017 family protein n=1 Tax=Ilumatobacter sp. TaxID=1967498 RepID=UPI0039187342